MRINWRVVLLIGLAAIAALVVCLIPPVHQEPAYHHFADGRTIFGISNFWNVVSNPLFLLVALWGLFKLGYFAEPWERSAYIVLLAGLALVAFGSGWYHFHPNDATLFWDRLPMTIVFMTLLATTVGERVSSNAGRRCYCLCWPPVYAACCFGKPRAT